MKASPMHSREKSKVKLMLVHKEFIFIVPIISQYIAESEFCYGQRNGNGNEFVD